MHLIVEIFLLGVLVRMTAAQQTTTTTTTTTTSPTTTTTASTTTTTSPTTTTTSPTTTTTTGTTSTTTTTAPSTTTTTPNGDIAPTAAQLWNVNYYYNWFLGTHAFCADTACTDAIKTNGIGYDMNFGKGLLGKAVSEASIAAVRTACPIGSASLRNLGFEKSGNHYVHNLNGAGLKQGWVSTVNGACGAKVPIKRWKSRFTDDMMYTVNLDWNMWYQGMVQDAGAVLFYMWE